MFGPLEDSIVKRPLAWRRPAYIVTIAVGFLPPVPRIGKGKQFSPGHSLIVLLHRCFDLLCLPVNAQKLIDATLLIFSAKLPLYLLLSLLQVRPSSLRKMRCCSRQKSFTLLPKQGTPKDPLPTKLGI